MHELIAIIDIGKTNAKLSLVDIETGATTWSLERRYPSVHRLGIRSLDVMGIENMILTGLATAPGKERIRAILPVAHGAAAVLLSSAGEVITAPDYEDSAFGSVGETYRRLRDPFELTFSPFLPLGLNLGRQLYYIQHTHPELFRSCASILLYPQYWAWRLSGVMASEITSLGCHSDLWQPRERDFSDLAKSQSWARLFPDQSPAGNSLGRILPTVSRLTGIDPTCQVLCGIHDSNASYLCHRASRHADERFAVISSGTWTVILAHGTDLGRLDENRDMLANIDAFGSPVPTARFMGGREYEVIAGERKLDRQPTGDSLEAVLEQDAMALPSFAGTGGPFVGSRGKLLNAEKLDDLQRGALATLYCALQSDLLLDMLGEPSTVIIDGPLTQNPLFGPTLARFRTGSIQNRNAQVSCSVLNSDNRAGPTECGRLFLGHRPQSNLRPAQPLELPGLEEYRDKWRAALPAINPSSKLHAELQAEPHTRA
jgi:sugar (pentulose or hexulose) kinase